MGHLHVAWLNGFPKVIQLGRDGTGTLCLLSKVTRILCHNYLKTKEYSKSNLHILQYIYAHHCILKYPFLETTTWTSSPSLA